MMEHYENVMVIEIVYSQQLLWDIIPAFWSPAPNQICSKRIEITAAAENLL